MKERTTVTLQIPLEKEKRGKLNSIAKLEGFASAQNLTRFVIDKIIRGDITFTVQKRELPSIQMSERMEKDLIKMDAELDQEIKDGSSRSFEDLYNEE